MGGLAFAFFYTTLGIPIARLADTHNRRNIIAICLAVWSGMTAICGLAQSFWQLLLARVGVAVGEAGGSPPAHSMISDLFAADHRATALGIYALGIPVGTMLGNLAALDQRGDGSYPRSRPGVDGIRHAAPSSSRRAAGQVVRRGPTRADRVRVPRAWSRRSLLHGARRRVACARRLRCRTVHRTTIRACGAGTADISTALFWLGLQGLPACERRLGRRPVASATCAGMSGSPASPR
jgi:hypothetical protein